MWTRDLTLRELDSTEQANTPAVHEVMNRSLALAHRNKKSRSPYEPGGDVAPEVVADLGVVPNSELRTDTARGGAGPNLHSLAQSIRDMTSVEPWEAGTSSRVRAGLNPAKAQTAR